MTVWFYLDDGSWERDVFGAGREFGSWNIAKNHWHDPYRDGVPCRVSGLCRILYGWVQPGAESDSRACRYDPRYRLDLDHVGDLGPAQRMDT